MLKSVGEKFGINKQTECCKFSMNESRYKPATLHENKHILGIKYCRKTCGCGFFNEI